MGNRDELLPSFALWIVSPVALSEDSLLADRRCSVEFSLSFLDWLREESHDVLTGRSLDAVQPVSTALNKPPSSLSDADFPPLGSPAPAARSVSTSQATEKARAWRAERPSDVPQSPPPHQAPSRAGKSKGKRRINPTPVARAPRDGDLTRVPDNGIVWPSRQESLGHAGRKGLIDEDENAPPPADSFETPIKGRAKSVSSVGKSEKSSMRKTPLLSAAAASFSVDRDRLCAVAHVYATLIRLRLTPKLATELHLLVRLLTVDETVYVPAPPRKLDLLRDEAVEDSARSSVTGILETGLACNILAAKTLGGLRSLVLSLGAPLLSLLSDSPAMRREAKELADAAGHCARQEESRAVFEGEAGAATKVTIVPEVADAQSLVVPFCAEKDARHLYQASHWTRDVYKRQEEARDVFLQLLRDFQRAKRELDCRGLENFLHELPHKTTQLLRGLPSLSLAWFADLFRATLLQIGLCSVQETDEDVLQLKTRGSSSEAASKVQKLQGRLYGKSASLEVSSHRCRSKGPSATSTAAVPAGPRTPSPESYFPGNQEFFFRFIRACDSARLNHILQRMLGSDLMRWLSCKRGTYDEPDNASCSYMHLARLKIIAKFLGLLTFSPNWAAPGEALQSLSPQDPLQHMLTEQALLADRLPPAFPSLDILQTCWASSRATLAMPCLLDYFRMMRWDSVFPRTSYHAQIIQLLCAMHAALGASFNEVTEASDPASSDSGPVSASLFLTIELEDFFSELDVDHLNIPNSSENGVVLDGYGHHEASVSFSRRFMELCSKPLADLLQVLSVATSAVKARVTTSSLTPIKRVRPYTTQASCPSKPSLTARLESAFFQQHPHLQRYAEVSVQAALRNALVIALDTCVQEGVERAVEGVTAEQVTDSVVFAKLVDEARASVARHTRKTVKHFFEVRVPSCLELLARPGMHAGVVDVAAQLAVQHALDKGLEPVGAEVRVTVHRRLTTWREALIRGKGAVDIGRTDTTARSVWQESLRTLLDLRSQLRETTRWRPADVMTAMRRGCDVITRVVEVLSAPGSVVQPTADEVEDLVASSIAMASLGAPRRQHDCAQAMIAEESEAVALVLVELLNLWRALKPLPSWDAVRVHVKHAMLRTPSLLACLATTEGRLDDFVTGLLSLAVFRRQEIIEVLRKSVEHTSRCALGHNTRRRLEKALALHDCDRDHETCSAKAQSTA